MPKPNEFKIDVTVDAGQLRGEFQKALTNALSNKVIDKALDKKITDYSGGILKSMEGIQKSANIIQRLADGIFASEDLEQSNAVLNTTATIIRQIKSLLLDLGQMSLSDLITALKTLNKVAEANAGVLQGFINQDVEGAPSTLNIAAIDKAGKQQTKEVDQQIALLQGKQTLLRKTTDMTFTFDDLPKGEKKLNANSTIADIKEYASSVMSELGAAKKEIDDKWFDTIAIVEEGSPEEQQVNEDRYRAISEAQINAAQKIIAVNNLLKEKGEDGDKIFDNWNSVVEGAVSSLSDEKIVGAIGKIDAVYARTEAEIDQLEKRREEIVNRVVALGVSKATDMTPKTEEQLKAEAEAAEAERAKKKIEASLKAKAAQTDDAIEKAARLSEPQSNNDKPEIPNVITGLSKKTAEEEKELNEIYERLVRINELSDKSSDVYKGFWKNIEELNGEEINPKKVSDRFARAYYNEDRTGQYKGKPVPLGATALRDNGKKVPVKELKRTLDDAEFMIGLSSAIDEGIIESVQDFPNSLHKTGAKTTDLSGETLKNKIKPVAKQFLQDALLQVATVLGKTIETTVTEEVVQADVAKAKPTTANSPTKIEAESTVSAPAMPKAEVPFGDDNGGPPNTVVVNVAYNKTRDQLTKELLQLLNQLQSVLNSHPLKFALEDPNPEEGSLQTILKALSKNTAHTITIQVNKASINSMAAAEHQIINLINLWNRAKGGISELGTKTYEELGLNPNDFKNSLDDVPEFNTEQLESFVKSFKALFQSADGKNYFETINESVLKLNESFDQLLKKELTVKQSFSDSEAADSLWFDVQNASHKLFQKSSHKDAIGDVSQYKLIDRESDAYKKLSEVLFELYDRYKALGGVRNLSEVVEDEWYNLNDKVKAPGSADLNKIEQDYADRVARRVNGEGITNQFKELLSILNQLTSKFGELLELYKSINRVADESTLASKWSEVQQNMLKMVNSKGEIDYDKKGFVDLQSSFHKSYREYRDLGGTLDFNDLRMYDTSSLKPNAYESFFKDYSASEYSPTQTPLGGVNDFILRLGDGARQASVNIELLESKIKSLEDALQTSNSVSGFFAKLSENLQPAKEYFDSLTEKVKSIETQQQNIKIDSDDLVKPYEELTKILEGVKESLNSILELYKAINGVGSQSALDERWQDVSDAFNGRGKFLGNGLLNARGAIDPNKNADSFFEALARYQRAGGTKQISDLTRIGADRVTGEDRPITPLAASNLGWRYEEYRNQQLAQAQTPLNLNLTTVESKIDGIKSLIDTNLQSIKTAVDSIKATIDALPQSLQNEQQVGQQDVENRAAKISFDAINRSIASMSQQITNELGEKIPPVMAEALYQMRLATGELEQQVVGIPKQRRGHSWWEQYLETDYFGKENARLAYREGKYKPYPITLDLSGMGFSGIPSDLQEAQNKIGKNLSKLGIIRLKKIAQEYQSLINTDALEQYYKAIREQDQITRAYLENRFETLRIASDSFLKDMEAGKYAAYNSSGKLKDTGKFWRRPEDATEEIKRLTSSQNIPQKWLPAMGGKFSGNFIKEGVWSGTGVDSAGNATKITYAYDPFNKDIRELRVDLPKETKKNQQAIDKQKKYFETLQANFFENVAAEIAGVKIDDIKKDSFSGVLSTVTAKTDELATLREQIYVMLNQDGWDKLNSKIGLGVVSKTDAEYQRFQSLLDLLDKFEKKAKEVNSFVGSSNGEGWLSNNKGVVERQDIHNDSTSIAHAIDEIKGQIQSQYQNGSMLVGKLSSNGQSFSGQITDAIGQVHDIAIAYDEATQSVRLFDQVNDKATINLVQKSKTQADAVSNSMADVVKLSQTTIGGVDFGNFDGLQDQVTSDVYRQLLDLKQMYDSYRNLISEANNNGTSWAEVAKAEALGIAEPFEKAYQKLKKLLGLRDDMVDLSSIINKVLSPGNGSGWLNNGSGKLMGLSGIGNLSPSGALPHIKDYLSKQGYTDLIPTDKNKGEYDASRGLWSLIGTKDEKKFEITIQADSANRDLRMLVEESDGVQKGVKKAESSIIRLNASGDQMFNTFKRVATTLTPLVTVINSATQAFQNGYNTLVDYDKALTNISYTMTLSKQQLQDLGQATIDMAKDLNLSISDAMSVAQIYANMQTTPEEIVELSRPTAILANLSGQNTETAANYVQSVIEQFGMAEEDAMHIVDVYDTVSANIKMDYAKGIGVIASATEAAGQVAKDAGLSFEQLAAIVAKVAERTREEGSSIGNALKTIITRLSKASQLSGADEVDNETLSKASAALADIGIQVYTSEGEFRSFGTIIGELADKWDSLTDVQQSNLSYQIAATRLT